MEPVTNGYKDIGSYQKLAVCITFHYINERLVYLNRVCAGLVGIAPSVHLTIITNTHKSAELDSIRIQVDADKIHLEILTPENLGHPYLLAWSHYVVFKRLVNDPSYTHFLYLEDDIEVTGDNILYWLQAREKLRSKGFFPSFFRKELNINDGKWYSSDVMKKMSLYDCPGIITDDGSAFIGIVYPYQAMYFYDRELMQEHLSAPSSNPDFRHSNGGIFTQHHYGIREKAALALTFMHVPTNFRSRNLLPFDSVTSQIDRHCMVHHLPNTYANNPSETGGKVQVDDLFIPRSFKAYLNKQVKTTISAILRKFLSLK